MTATEFWVILAAGWYAGVWQAMFWGLLALYAANALGRISARLGDIAWQVSRRRDRD